MTMTTANQVTFRFGVELEMLLGSRAKKHKTWASLATELSTRLAKAGIANHINAGNEKTAENYREWSLVQEVTVPREVEKGLWGMELVSPILSPSPAEHWVGQLRAIFAVLKKHFVLTASPHTSTHVHVSTDPTLPPAALAAVAKAALYFEPALDALLPASRSSSNSGTYWCQSNRASVAMRGVGGGLMECFALLDRCAGVGGGVAGGVGYGAGDAYAEGGMGGVEPLIRAMCLFPASSAYGRAHGYASDFVHGVYKWDFSGLLPDTGSGTLEYRQPPGSRTADEARAWIEVGLCFVAGAVDAGHSLDPLAQADATMEDLWWVLCAGAQSTGLGELKGIEGVDFARGKTRVKSGRK
ncbi:hypothetical protein DL769_010657 [Monosporascus sp. CRB-8-3]|nr:hypothetical protein DL769_010657 [Monosporascus sp. CRB-8-3]